MRENPFIEVETLFQGGRRWGKGRFYDPRDDTYCLVGALREVSGAHAVRYARAMRYVKRLTGERSAWGITFFNDCANYSIVRDVVREAAEQWEARRLVNRFRRKRAPAPQPVLVHRSLPVDLNTPNKEDSMVTGTLKVMSRTQGHATFTWDKTDEMSVEQVRAQFDTLIRDGFQGYRVDEANPENQEVIRHFDPDAREIIMAAPLVGG